MEPTCRENFRLRQANQLVGAGIAKLPHWIPAIVDSCIGPIPAITQVEAEGQIIIFLTWIHKQGDKTTTRRWELCRESIVGDLLDSGDLTPEQLQIVSGLAAEQRHVMTVRELEGWE